MSTPRRCKSVVVLLSLLALSLAAGCTQLPPQTDVEQARSALTAALDIWREGQPVEKLRDRAPPVDFRDLSWEQGCKLKSYEVQKAEVSGASAQFTVKLDITEKSGTTRTRVVVYSADAGHTIVIRPGALGLE